MITLFAASALAGPPQAALRTTAVLPRQVIRPGDPVEVYLAMENRTDEVLWFEQHATGPCFLHKFAEIVITSGATAKPLEGDCKAPSSEVKPGGVVSKTVDLRQAFAIAEQTFTLKVAWKDGGPDIYSPLSQRLGPISFKSPFFEDRLQKGGEVYLPNKTTLVFDGHANQPSSRRGEPPLLVLNFTARIPGQGEEARLVRLPIDTRRQFVVEGYTIDIVDYQFDQWMVVRIFE